MVFAIVMLQILKNHMNKSCDYMNSLSNNYYKNIGKMIYTDILALAADYCRQNP